MCFCGMISFGTARENGIHKWWSIYPTTTTKFNTYTLNLTNLMDLKINGGNFLSIDIFICYFKRKVCLIFIKHHNFISCCSISILFINSTIQPLQRVPVSIDNCQVRIIVRIVISIICKIRILYFKIQPGFCFHNITDLYSMIFFVYLICYV